MNIFKLRSNKQTRKKNKMIIKLNKEEYTVLLEDCLKHIKEMKRELDQENKKDPFNFIDAFKQKLKVYSSIAKQLREDK